MFNNIFDVHSKHDSLSDTEICILKGATKLFLKNGFSKTTYRMIASETGVGLGTITYYYRTKEDLLKFLVEELMEFHSDIIEETIENMDNKLLAYAMEIAVQIALCENNKNAYDLYYSAYSHRTTFDYIKEWASKKSYFLLGDKLSQFKESDFNVLENIISGIELSAFTFHCNRYFTLEDKIALVLNSIMKIYEIPEKERKEIIEEIKSLECDKLGERIFQGFVKKLTESVQE